MTELDQDRQDFDQLVKAQQRIIQLEERLEAQRAWARAWKATAVNYRRMTRFYAAHTLDLALLELAPEDAPCQP